MSGKFEEFDMDYMNPAARSINNIRRLLFNIVDKTFISEDRKKLLLSYSEQYPRYTSDERSLTFCKNPEVCKMV